MSFTTVSAPAGLTLSATAPAWHWCPYVTEKDEGTVTITWVTKGRTFELHSLRRHLNEFMAQWGHEEISHERFTKEVRESLDMNGHLHGLVVSTVRSEWTTAGMPVTCSI